MAVSESELRRMAVLWVDAEIQRLRAVRQELVRRRQMTPEREAEVRRAIVGTAHREAKALHWTKRPENRAKVREAVRRMHRAKKAVAS